MNKKNVQISYDLFYALCQYHLLNERSNITEDYIKYELEDKLNRVCNHIEYSQKRQKE